MHKLVYESKGFVENGRHKIILHCSVKYSMVDSFEICWRIINYDSYKGDGLETIVQNIGLNS